MPNDLAQFWTDEGWWAVEPPGYVFLARATRRIGAALYPARWTDRDPWTDLPPVLPERPDSLSLVQPRQRWNLLTGC